MFKSWPMPYTFTLSWKLTLLHLIIGFHYVAFTVSLSPFQLCLFEKKAAYIQMYKCWSDYKKLKVHTLQIHLSVWQSRKTALEKHLLSNHSSHLWAQKRLHCQYYLIQENRLMSVSVDWLQVFIALLLYYNTFLLWDLQCTFEMFSIVNILEEIRGQRAFLTPDTCNPLSSVRRIRDPLEIESEEVAQINLLEFHI